MLPKPICFVIIYRVNSLNVRKQLFRLSSAVERLAVNEDVAGSNPAVGAMKRPLAFASGFFIVSRLGLNQQQRKYFYSWYNM